MSEDEEPEPSGLDGLPPMFSIAQGEVVSVQTYGAFVRLPGYKKEGWLSFVIISSSWKNAQYSKKSEITCTWDALNIALNISIVDNVHFLKQ